VKAKVPRDADDRKISLGKQTASNSLPKSRLNQSRHSQIVAVLRPGRPVMERTTFLNNYRIRLQYDGSPVEPDRNGPAIGHEAVDERTGEPVFVTLVPIESIDPAQRQQFETDALAAQKLRHVNIAKVLDFGREGDDFVYVSEHLPGETLAAWVRSHGPMPIDAALRVAEQIVSVLSSASFHKLPFPPIQPSDVLVVPGQTPEGTWPLVKLTNFGLPPLILPADSQPAQSTIDGPPLASDQVDRDQLSLATADIRSEIFSLGMTLYFLLTGVALVAEELRRTPKVSQFPKPLRALLGRMLHRDPNERPKDLVVLAEMIRQCLLKIERRRQFADKYGLPFRRTIPRPAEVRSNRLRRSVIAVGALLMAAALLAPVLFPETIREIVHRSRETKNLGVLVGVPDASKRPPPQNASSTVAPLTAASQAANATATSQVPNTAVAQQGAKVGGMSQSANATLASANQPNVSNAPGSAQTAAPDVQQTQTSVAQVQAAPQNAQPQPAVPDTSVPGSSAAVAESSPSSTGETNSSIQADAGAQTNTANQSSSRSKKKNVASASRRAQTGQASPDDSAPRGSRSVRARVVGITSDGRLILRLPSGRTAFVAPDEQGEVAPRRHRRRMSDEDQMFAPAPQFAPDLFPND
jgi:serine/threonine protein kinase